MKRRSFQEGQSQDSRFNKETEQFERFDHPPSFMDNHIKMNE